MVQCSVFVCFLSAIYKPLILFSGETSLLIYKMGINDALSRGCINLAISSPWCKLRDVGTALGLNSCRLLQARFGVALAIWTPWHLVYFLSNNFITWLPEENFWFGEFVMSGRRSPCLIASMSKQFKLIPFHHLIFATRLDPFLKKRTYHVSTGGACELWLFLCPRFIFC